VRDAIVTDGTRGHIERRNEFAGRLLGVSRRLRVKRRHRAGTAALGIRQTGSPGPHERQPTPPTPGSVSVGSVHPKDVNADVRHDEAKHHSFRSDARDPTQVVDELIFPLLNGMSLRPREPGGVREAFLRRASRVVGVLTDHHIPVGGQRVPRVGSASRVTRRRYVTASWLNSRSTAAARATVSAKREATDVVSMFANQRASWGGEGMSCVGLECASAHASPAALTGLPGRA
jgi:hypothetical protein